MGNALKKKSQMVSWQVSITNIYLVGKVENSSQRGFCISVDSFKEKENIYSMASV